MLFSRTHEDRACRDLHRMLDHLHSRLEPTRGSALASGDPWNPLFAAGGPVVMPDGLGGDALDAEIAEIQRAMFDLGCDLPERSRPRTQRAARAAAAQPAEPPPVTMSQ